MKDTAFLDNYEALLEEGLVKLCKGAGLLREGLLESPDITGKWDSYIKDYTADAVENFNSFPEAAISWAGFLGMGVAHGWDFDWERIKDLPYSSYYGARGWDDMDEHVLKDILGLEESSDEYRHLSDTMLSCALATLGLIRHEGIECCTEQGFYVLTRSYTVLYRIGASIELERLGYKKKFIA